MISPLSPPSLIRHSTSASWDLRSVTDALRKVESWLALSNTKKMKKSKCEVDDAIEALRRADTDFSYVSHLLDRMDENSQPLDLKAFMQDIEYLQQKVVKRSKRIHLLRILVSSGCRVLRWSSECLKIASVVAVCIPSGAAAAFLCVAVLLPAVEMALHFLQKCDAPLSCQEKNLKEVLQNLQYVRDSLDSIYFIEINVKQ
ncbi:hypothetical protein SCHPADRAFT_536946 [Schizopora paradoxa]|uniref:Uncharacterized protein n=1 Tax=Schizopora paradoxa TaxID=27342 RepID=A0A0H2RDX4_9AGAM|nr:hypothetical protein SCHPADRAFT_536946 [Schizopora paradoxa]